MKNLLFIIVILIFSLGSLKAQDKIYLRHDTINARIVENGIKSYKYQVGNSIIEEIRKKHVLKVEFANDSVVDFGSNNPRKIRPFSFGFYISHYLKDDSFCIDFKMNKFIKPYFSLGGGAGIDLNSNAFFSFGPQFYFNKVMSKQRLVPYAGLHVGIARVEQDNLPALMIPFGLDYISKNGFNIALEFNYRMIYDNDNQFVGGIRIGMNF